ncbi:MAG: calmodulin-binding protein [Thermoguttaceae bacterium]|nr:calmodulin-binding protein [Thermoguttaceae bacterium]MDO4858019.1 calmodulin-binding protein [Thermoguttaceae bacterium]
MIRHLPILLLAAALFAVFVNDASARQPRGIGMFGPTGPGTTYNNYTPAYGEHWGKNYNTQDWNRFYHYPYIYYPQNYYPATYYRSADNMYYRYPPEMRIPIYDKKNYNFYPEPHPYHDGFHYTVDIF